MLVNAAFFVGGVLSMYFYSAAISPVVAKVIAWFKAL